MSWFPCGSSAKLEVIYGKSVLPRPQRRLWHMKRMMTVTSWHTSTQMLAENRWHFQGRGTDGHVTSPWQTPRVRDCGLLGSKSRQKDSEMWWLGSWSCHLSRAALTWETPIVHMIILQGGSWLGRGALALINSMSWSKKEQGCPGVMLTYFPVYKTDSLITECHKVTISIHSREWKFHVMTVLSL